MKSSSNTNGRAKARANGQPIIAPAAKSNVAVSVGWLLVSEDGPTDTANANVVVYIAKDDGRKAESIIKSQVHVRI
jgi:hypothetical protein